MTPRVLAACAAFGLLPERERGGARRRRARAAARAIDRRLGPGRVGVLLGPSGAGKSVVLRALAEHLGERACAVRPLGVRLGRRAVIDTIPGPVPAALRALAAAGLGEAPLLARRAWCLSDGQRSRLSLARVLARARPGQTLLLDEFGSGIDAAARESLAVTASRWSRRSGVRAVAATVHERVARAMNADVLLRVGPDGSVTEARVRRARVGLAIEPGNIADYHALAHLHYRAGRPATVVRVLRARRGPDIVGVLVVSMPTLDGWWRELAWPGRFRTGDRARDTARLNREVRCLSRVVVDPRWRGMGIARRLVRAYLRRPLTLLTESCAAMGAWCPFFAAAGMTEYHAPPAARDARLGDALHACGLDAHELLRPGGWPPLLRCEARRWARASRVTAGLPGEREIGAAAWRALGAPRVAYAACRAGGAR